MLCGHKTLVIFIIVAATIMISSVSSFKLFRSTYMVPKSFMCTTNSGRFVENISSTSNPKVKLMKSLSIKKKREELNLIIVEGQRVILDALESGASPKHVMYSDRAFNSPLRDRLEQAFRKLPRDCSISKVTDSVLSSLSETVTDQGVVAAFLQPTAKDSQLTSLLETKNSALVVVLDGIRDPGNMGTLLRTSYGLGADAFVCVNGCDAWSPKVLRAATGVQLTCSNNVMPVVEHVDWRSLYDVLWAREKAIDSKKEEGESKGKDSSNSCALSPIQIVIADSGEGSIPYTSIDFTLPSLLVVGSEADGVSKVAREAPGTVVRAAIPLLRKLDSFNAAVAGSILLAEAARQRSSLAAR